VTPWQAAYLARNRQTAASAAASARPLLLEIMRNASFGELLTGMGLGDVAALAPDLQLARFQEELLLSETTHGFQASVAEQLAQNAKAGGFHSSECNNCGDVDLAVEASATHLHNLWELPSLGLRCTPDGNSTRGSGDCFTEDWLRGCDQAERYLFCAGENRTHCFPPFTRTIPHGVEWSSGPEPWPAGMAESIERPVYNAINFKRTDHGIGQFGAISVVLNLSFIEPLAVLVPMDSGDFEGGCNKTNQNSHVDCRDPKLQRNATACNATVVNGGQHCQYRAARTFGPGHPVHPAECDWPPQPPDPMYSTLPNVCHGFWLHHGTYLNGSVLERFRGPNASIHCCSSCNGWNGTGVDKAKKALCDGWQIPDKTDLTECFTIKNGTGHELPNPGEKVLSGQNPQSGGGHGWHRRQSNCSAWEPSPTTGRGAELGTFKHWEHTLLAMINYNSGTSPQAGLANLFGATFLPWSVRLCDTFSICLRT